MRILICNYEYPPLGGGGGKITYLLAQEFAKRHEVTVLTSQWHNLPRKQIENGVRVIRVPVFFRRHRTAASLLSLLSYVPMAISEGKKLKNNINFDVINTHFVLPTGPVGDYLSGFFGVPNVLTLHGGDIYDPTKLYSPHRYILLRVWIRRLLSRANAIVVNSYNTLNNMHRYYNSGIIESKCIKIPLGIKQTETDSALRESYGFSQDDILLVTIGRLIPRKSNIQLIRMIEKLDNQKVFLILIGTGPQENMLKKECHNKHLDKQIIFMGNVEEEIKFSILKMCNVYVSTSQHEGFGLVFLEAMHCGLPIVSYDNGGHTEFLENQKTGFIVPNENLNDFEEKCSWLIKNPEAKKKMGNYNKELVNKYYIEHCASKYERLFEEIVETNNNNEIIFSRDQHRY